MKGMYSGSGQIVDLIEWWNWFPVLTQLSVVAATINYARYVQQGKMVIANFDLGVTGTGTTANAITVSVPVPHYTVPAGAAPQIGGMMIYRSSTTTRYDGSAELQAGATAVGLSYSQASASVVGISPAFALAAGDILRGTLMYEAA